MTKCPHCSKDISNEQACSGHNGSDTVSLDIPKSLVTTVLDALRVGRNVQMMGSNPEGQAAMAALITTLKSTQEDLSFAFFNSSNWSRIQLLVAAGHPFDVVDDPHSNRIWGDKEQVVMVFDKDDQTKTVMGVKISSLDVKNKGKDIKDVVADIKSHLSQLAPMS